MRPWWGRDVDSAQAAEQAAVRAEGPEPVLVDATSSAVRGEVRDRISAFTPDWATQRRDDAGVAFVRLFGDLVEPVLARMNHLPAKLLVDHLRTAGIGLRPATASRVLLQFEVARTAAAAVLVPQGFQVAAPPATGEGGRVVFETERALVASPVELAEARTQHLQVVDPVDAASLAVGTARVAPFGERPRPGAALWLGVTSSIDLRSLALHIELAPEGDRPRAVARGGTLPPPSLPPPVVRWHALIEGRLERLEVTFDDTDGLRRNGIIELAVSGRWTPSLPADLRADRELRWLRVQLVHGAYGRPPVVAAVRLNAVNASAGRTIRNEALEVVANAGQAGTQMRVSQTPVLARTLEIEVDTVVQTDVFGISDAGTPAPTVQRWEEVDSLAGVGGDRLVYVVDSERGLVTFGDGRNGARVPLGFRNVRATRYRVGGGSAGAVAADAGFSMLTTLPNLTGVANPRPASGGTDAEPRARALRRGPRELRARGRAVNVADYVLRAVEAPGANVGRAHAVPGLHPDLGGVPIPGLVGVFVVPRTGDSPFPDEGSLDAVARHLTQRVAPVGVQVVAGSPRYDTVRVEARIVTSRRVDQAAVVSATTAAIDRWLDRLEGGEDGEGWPFGAPVRHAALVRHLLGTVDGLRAVPTLNLVVDGRRLAPCEDHLTRPHALILSSGHEVVPVEEGSDG